MVDHPVRVTEVALDPFTDPISGAELRNHAISVAISRHFCVETIAIRQFCVNRTDVSVSRQCPTVRHFTEALAAKVLDAILANAPQVVLLEGVELIELTEMLCRKRRHGRPRIVFDFHNVESNLLKEFDSARFPKCLRPLASTLYGRRWQHAERAEVRAVELADQVWSCSEDDARRLAALLPTEQLRSKIKVIPNVVPLWCQEALEHKLPPLQSTTQSSRALFLGHLRYPPNLRAVDRLLRDIWPAVRARFPQMQLTIAGRRPSKSLRRRVGRAAGVQLEANPTDLDALYRNIGLVIIPLDQGGGTRLKILEALALGKPIIATDKAVEGLELVTGEDWLPAHQTHEYVEQIGRVLEDSTLHHKLATSGQERVRSKYTCQAISQSIREFLQSLQVEAGEGYVESAQ